LELLRRTVNSAHRSIHYVPSPCGQRYLRISNRSSFPRKRESRYPASILDSRLPGCVKTRTQIFRWEYVCKKIQILVLWWGNCTIFPQHLDIEWEIFQVRKKFLEFLHSLLRGNDDHPLNRRYPRLKGRFSGCCRGRGIVQIIPVNKQLRIGGSMGGNLARILTVSAVAAMVTLVAPSSGYAQSKYPRHTVTLVTHSSPGGGSDVFIRELIRHLGPEMGVNFVVENRPGGSGAKAVAKVAQSPGDGSIFYVTTPTYIQTTLLSKVDFGYDSLDPIVTVFHDPTIVYTRTQSPFKTLAD